MTSVIEAEDFDVGSTGTPAGEGCAYHDTTVQNDGGQYRSGGVDLQACGDAGGGYQVAYIQPLEWLKYTVIVATTGSYTFTFRVASFSGCADAFHLEDELGTDLTGPVSVLPTGSGSTFADVAKTGGTLTAGGHVLRLVVDAGNNSWSLNYFSAALTSGCAAETDSAFCSRLGKNCGGATARDNCGRDRTVASCGTCTAPETCGGGGTANVCACQPETDAAFCSRLGKTCGPATGADNCGASRAVSCGACP